MREQHLLNHCVGVCRVKSINPSETHPHGQLRPGSLNWITSKKDHLQVWEITDDSLNHLIIQHRIGWRDVARKTRPFVREQARIIFDVDIGQGAQAIYALQKASVAIVSAARWVYAFSLGQLVKIMQFLQRRHPEIGMWLAL